MSVPGEFDTIAVGAPTFGHDTGEDGERIWYFDGSPAAVVCLISFSLRRRGAVANQSCTLVYQIISGSDRI